MLNFTETLKALPMYFKAKIVPCLIGHTGIGKTQLAEQYTMKNGMDLIVIHVAQLEPSDFVGLYKTTEDGRTANCPPNWLPYKVGEGNKIDIDNKNITAFLTSGKNGYINPKGGIIFLDEINRGHEDIRQALYQFITTGKIHTYAKPGNYHIMAAANPSEHYETYEFDGALTNRFAWVKFQPTHEEVFKYLEGKHGRNHVVSWLRTNKDLLDLGNDDFEINDMRLSPRMTESSIMLYEELKEEPKEFTRKILETVVQKEKVQSFLSYLEEIKHISFTDVLAGKKKEKVKELISTKRNDVISTITLDLGDLFNKYQMGQEVSEYIPAGKEQDSIKNLSDFLKELSDGGFDELITTFIDMFNRDGFNPNNKKSLYGNAYFRKALENLAKYKRLFGEKELKN